MSNGLSAGKKSPPDCRTGRAQFVIEVNGSGESRPAMQQYLMSIHAGEHLAFFVAARLALTAATLGLKNCSHLLGPGWTRVLLAVLPR
jgi:hypothetical protein